MDRKSFDIRTPKPFSLAATVLGHGWHECAPMSWSEGGRCFQIILRNGKGAMRVSVVEGKPTRRDAVLNVSVDGDELSDATVAHIESGVRHMLGLDENLDEFYDLCRDHPTLHVLPRIGAGRTPRSVSLTEDIIKTILGTNVNWSQAVKMINRLAQLGPIVRHFRSLNAWPTPREILRAGPHYLNDVCRAGYRTESILELCKDVAEKRTDPDELTRLATDPNVSSHELLSRLRSIRGIGPTSANYLLGFLGRHDRLAIDTSTVAHVSRTHLKGKKATPKQIEEIYDRYGRWKNKVWWFELWLEWDTARRIVEEATSNGRSS
ncbi:MAG: DNA-3-methyladenine glycosylase 2 family protein [Phycisphaerae bacterium]|nr:DNA-3-methyladenine glycosylase 2 family protein [Phycisphaerae bacterium]